MPENHYVAVTAIDDSRISEAKLFAENNDLRFVEDPSGVDLVLSFEKDRLSLIDNELDTSIQVDFIKGALAHRKQFGGGKGQAIAKAIGLNKKKSLSVLDVTAGLARDAFIISTLGCVVTLIERSSILCRLVEDGLDNARRHDESLSLENIEGPINMDSTIYLESLKTDDHPDVIYMDPMYPERKKSAKVKKDMQILHKLIGPEIEAEQLLDKAVQYATFRTVVKRPMSASPIGDRRPDFSITSKKTRYDIYNAMNKSAN